MYPELTFTKQWAVKTNPAVPSVLVTKKEQESTGVRQGSDFAG